MGGANELLSVAAASVPGAGVPFVSEASGAGALMMGVEAGAGEAVADGSEASSDGEMTFLSRWGAKRRMTILLGLRDNLADGLCDGVVAIVMDVGDWLGATTWIAPVVGGAAGFVSSDLGVDQWQACRVWELLAVGGGISRNRWVVVVM